MIDLNTLGIAVEYVLLNVFDECNCPVRLGVYTN